jgi:S-formylglutathione hydrolase FrmB
VVSFRGIVNPGDLPVTQDELEALVDELGLVSVVSLLATVCHDKAQHILRLRGKGASLYTAWNSNAFMLRQLMTRLRPTDSYDPEIDPYGD